MMANTCSLCMEGLWKWKESKWRLVEMYNIVPSMVPAVVFPFNGSSSRVSIQSFHQSCFHSIVPSVVFPFNGSISRVSIQRFRQSCFPCIHGLHEVKLSDGFQQFQTNYETVCYRHFKISKIENVRKPLLTNFEEAIWFSIAESYNLFSEKICRTDEFPKYPFLCKTDLRNIYDFEIRA